MILSPGGTMHKPPCQRCEVRRVGCHDNCPAYLEYKAKAQAVNEEVRNQRYTEGGMILYATIHEASKP